MQFAIKLYNLYNHCCSEASCPRVSFMPKPSRSGDATTLEDLRVVCLLLQEYLFAPPPGRVASYILFLSNRGARVEGRNSRKKEETGGKERTPKI